MSNQKICYVDRFYKFLVPLLCFRESEGSERSVALSPVILTSSFAFNQYGENVHRLYIDLFILLWMYSKKRQLSVNSVFPDNRFDYISESSICTILLLLQMIRASIQTTKSTYVVTTASDVWRELTSVTLPLRGTVETMTSFGTEVIGRADTRPIVDVSNTPSRIPYQNFS